MSRYKRYEKYKDSGVEWIGEIPEHWEFRRISHICALGRGRVISKIEIAENEGEYPVYSSQTENNGVLGYINTYDFEGDYITWTTDGANAGTVFRRTGRFNCTNVCGTLKSKENNLDLSYLTYALSLETKRYVRLDINPKLMNNEMAKIRVLFPPSDEQKAIANFLDQKTAEIDGLIADKEKLIELLQGKRQAIITEAVTKGLNPNVKMKDSGIEWIGEIPEHWNVEPIKYMVKTIQTGTTPTTKNDDYFDGDIQWFTPGDFHGSKELYEASRKISNLAVIDNEARLFPKNTVMIVGIGATVGKVAKLGVEGSFNQQITGLIVNEQRLNCDYLYYWLYINQETIKNISNYTTLPIINNEFVKNFECLSLPLDEQQAIVNYLNQKTSEIDDLILKIKLQIQKLKEYRQSLIFEAVTGKIDVRDYVVD